MRVISGKYKGKNLLGFDVDGTRPTMDRVKESLFGSIQNKVKNSVCLDLFAGSGSLGIEALSNGAKCCYFGDLNKEILKILKSNLKGIENSFVIEGDYLKILNELKDKKFDIIFLDPPFETDYAEKALKFISTNNMLKNEIAKLCHYV